MGSRLSVFMKTNAARMLILVLIIGIEMVFFSLHEPKFLTLGSLFETLRNYTEIGLIAFGMTFVIICSSRRNFYQRSYTTL
jgi:ribose/xylose/arabinose/galactoside ABC-type transport system permease subunit